MDGFDELVLPVGCGSRRYVMAIKASLPGLAAGTSLALVRLPVLQTRRHPIIMVAFINITLD